jgi:hypothetical protein
MLCYAMLCRFNRARNANDCLFQKECDRCFFVSVSAYLHHQTLRFLGDFGVAVPTGVLPLPVPEPEPLLPVGPG